MKKVAAVLLTVVIALLGGCHIYAKERTVWTTYMGVAQYLENGMVGLLSAAGTVLLEAEYEYINPYYVDEKAAVVKQNGLYGLFLLSGEWLFPPQWERIWVDGYRDGWIMVEADKHYAYVNTNGEVMTSEKWVLARSYSDGYALVEETDRGYFIDRAGNIALEIPEGMWVEDVFVKDGYITIGTRNGMGIMTMEGTFAIEPTWPDIDFCYADGHVRVFDIETEQYGFIDMTGKWVIPPVGPAVDSEYNEGYVTIDAGGSKGSYCYDSKGNIVFEFENAYANMHFSEGLLFLYEGEATGRIGYVNYKGELIIDIRKITGLDQGGMNGDFSEGLAFARGINGKYGYIDIKGEVKIDTRYDIAYDFCDGLALVCLEGEYGYINCDGKMVSGRVEARTQ